MSRFASQSIPFLAGKELILRSHRKILLGPIRVDIRSNEEDFVGMRYFPQNCGAEDGVEAEYTLSFCNLNLDTPWPKQTLSEVQDNRYRARRFAVGYYITDHFGSPAHLVTRGTHYWIFGTEFEAVLWPYFVKLLLTLYSIKQGMLHLKAASVAVDGVGSLMVGRGASGKTVLLTRLCQAGAQFLSNTHTLIDRQTMIAVPAAMRVRNDALFGPIIANRQLPLGIKPGEYLADPIADLGWQGCSTASLRNICLIDYRGPETCDVREIDRNILLDYMEQFSLPLNVYGLKEDMLDHAGGDVSEFSARVTRMKAQLRGLVDNCAGYYVSCDANDSRNLDLIRKLLGSSASR